MYLLQYTQLVTKIVFCTSSA